MWSNFLINWNICFKSKKINIPCWLSLHKQECFSINSIQILLQNSLNKKRKSCATMKSQRYWVSSYFCHWLFYLVMHLKGFIEKNITLNKGRWVDDLCGSLFSCRFIVWFDVRLFWGIAALKAASAYLCSLAEKMSIISFLKNFLKPERDF